MFQVPVAEGRYCLGERRHTIPLRQGTESVSIGHGKVQVNGSSLQDGFGVPE